MATKWEDEHVLCPYYRGTITNHSKTYISCEGIEYPGSMMRFFPDLSSRRAHMDKYCNQRSYWACPVCEVIDRIQYQKEEEQ